MEKTLVILKPCTVQRGLIGEIVNRFEKKGLRLTGMKMVWLTDEILSEHDAHLKEKPFFQMENLYFLKILPTYQGRDECMPGNCMLLGRGRCHTCSKNLGRRYQW